MERAESFDVIVIGSGIGGLAAASLLAQLGGKRVLVLERHFKLGGFTHTFQRRRFTFDVGLHYVGDMGEGEGSRRLFDLASGGAVSWRKMPSPFERFDYPGFRFDVPEGRDAYREALAQAFPRERRNVERWFGELSRASRWASRHFVGLLLPRAAASLLEAPGRSAALRTTGEVLARTFQDPLLRAVAASQWGDYGVPPSRSAFAMHAIVATHYFGGGYYPEGGAGVIAPAFAAPIEAAGGACHVNHEVTEILVEGDRVTGVRAVSRERGEARPVTFHAPLVVSDAGLPATFRLLGRAPPPGTEAGGGLSCVTLYLGLRTSPAALGFRGENHWMYEATDHDELHARRNEALAGRPASAYLSFPSLKDPAATAHTAELITFVDAEPFRAWREGRWMKRGAEYGELKATIARGLLDLVERRHPGFRDLVEHQEVSTPLTVEHFTGHPAGRIYGAPATPDRFRNRAFGVRTPVKGLLLAGADAGSLGIVGAFMGGVLAAGAAMGRFGIQKIFRAAARPAGARAQEARRAA